MQGLSRIVAISLFMSLVVGASAQAQEQEQEETTGVITSPAKPEPRTDVLSEFRPFRIGYIYVNDYYEEPGIMTEKGDMHGVSMVYEKFGERPHILGRVGGDLSFGTLTYDGGIMDKKTHKVSPYSTSGGDYIFNLKASVGVPVTFGNRVQVLHLVGYGFRYLNDQMLGYATYEREISYTYFPLGLEFRIFLNHGFAITASYEYDYFIAGQVKSHLTEVGYSQDLSNTQGSGHGDRFTIDFVKALESGREIHIAPYVQDWNIARSDLQVLDGERGWNEPPNYTVQYGVNVAFGL